MLVLVDGKRKCILLWGDQVGTQVDLFKKYLEEKGAESVLHVTTGGGFRAFIEADNFAAQS